MLRRFAIAVWRMLVARYDAWRSLLWVAANLGSAIRSLRVLFEMRWQGGSVVSVPSQAPLIRTLIQLDGDFVTYVDPSVFATHATREARSDLLRQYGAAMSARIPSWDARFSQYAASAASALRDMLVVGGLALEALGGVTPNAVLHDALSALLWQLAAIGIPLLLWFAAPRLLRFAINRAFRGTG